MSTAAIHQTLLLGDVEAAAAANVSLGTLDSV